MNYCGSNYNQCGCNDNVAPTYQQFNQVVQMCDVEDIPHYVNYHTHFVNNMVKRHVNIPTYSQSQENVIVNEYVNGYPMYQGYPMCNQQMMNNYPNMEQPNFDPNVQNNMFGYQGNVNPNYNPYRY